MINVNNINSLSPQFSNNVNDPNINSNTKGVGDSSVSKGADSEKTNEETYYHGKKTKIEGNTYYDKDGDKQRILYKKENSFFSVGIGSQVEEVENGIGGKARVSAKGTVQLDVGNGSCIKVEGEEYIEGGVWAEAEASLGSTKRVSKEGNDYIVYKQGISASARAGVAVGVRGTVSVYNGYDSIDGDVSISKGISGLEADFEVQKGVALNTNNWLLEFWGAFGLEIGDLLKFIPGVGEILEKVFGFGFRISLSGKVQLHEVAEQSKQEIKLEADNIFNQELNQMKQQTVNDLKQNNKVSKSEIQNKTQEIKNELYKRALLKAWNSKQHEVKQKLKTEAKNRIISILPKFARELINNRIAPLINSSLTSVPGFVRNGIIRILLTSGQEIGFIANMLILANFMAPIERVINEVKVTDFFKDVK
jgi:hypothetical protein